MGVVTPLQLHTHVNNVILPTLDLYGKNSTISDHTAINWLKKLSYTCKDVKKGLYHDGHKHPNVVIACQKFMEQYRQ